MYSKDLTLRADLVPNYIYAHVHHTCSWVLQYHTCIYLTFSTPVAPLRKKFHSSSVMRLACLMMSTHRLNENTILCCSNNPLRQREREGGREGGREREGRREGGGERGREGERERGREGERERGREGERDERERGREGEREGGSEGVREREGERDDRERGDEGERGGRKRDGGRERGRGREGERGRRGRDGEKERK